LQEEFEAFCSRLGARFGWSISDPSPYSNRSRPVETSVEFRERIAHDNAYDVQLYEFARELVAAQAASAGPS
jgi:hypothetical protein